MASAAGGILLRGLGAVMTLVRLGVVLLVSGLKLLREYERAVIFRLGRLGAFRGPGVTYVIPLVERLVRVALRTITLEIPPPDVTTRDHVSLRVSAVLYVRVRDPNKATGEIEHYLFATSQLAQTTLRSACGQAEWGELLAEREHLNARLQEILDAQAEPRGMKVSLVEVKHIDLPQDMPRAIAKQAEAERERRAKVINAAGEFQAVQRLVDAARIIEQPPAALPLRSLQTLAEVARGNDSTPLFPLPTDLLSPFWQKS